MMISPEHIFRCCFLSFFLLFFANTISAQTAEKVTDITAERDGDKISIQYRMPGSASDATYKVKITGAINGLPAAPLHSVTGDVGAAVKGGKARYTIVWDALKDISQIETAEFFVTAEKMAVVKPAKPDTPNVVKESKKRKWLIAVDAASNFNDVSALGLKMAWYKRWGGYLTVDFLNSEYKYYYRFMGGAVYSFNYPKSPEISVYLGGGAINHSRYSNFSNSIESVLNPALETGVTASFGVFAISMGGAWDDGDEIPLLTAGLGVRF